MGEGVICICNYLCVCEPGQIVEIMDGFFLFWLFGGFSQLW